MAKIAYGLIVVLAVSLGIAIYTEHRPEVPLGEVVRPGLERAEEIIEEDEKIRVLPEEAICPEKEGKEEKVDRLIQELRDEDRG
ncbi:hypothetical protein LR013_01830, partial [candidate division NPL-UPA2 bacterium]|nr:hypothetical protein [candidate division NPL-UPA2 bacterium]